MRGVAGGAKGTGSGMLAGRCFSEAVAATNMRVNSPGSWRRASGGTPGRGCRAGLRRMLRCRRNIQLLKYSGKLPGAGGLSSCGSILPAKSVAAAHRAAAPIGEPG